MENKYSNFHFKQDWENNDVLSINREQAHSRWGAYESETQALEGVYGSSLYMKSLNGSWQFKTYRNPNDVDDFYLPSYSKTADFKPINVPGNWELQGIENSRFEKSRIENSRFDKPIYTNHVYPWKINYEAKHTLQAKEGEWVHNPPYVAQDYNTAGCYRLSFNVPDSFQDRDVYLRFEGVETVYYLWVNGKPVGYSQDSKLPSEFNITPFLQEKENLLAVQVIRFADSSYLEDQDYWYLCGIYRDVWLISKPRLHIADWKISALPEIPAWVDPCKDADVPGRLCADIITSRAASYAECKVRLTLYDGKTKIAQGESDVMASAQYRSDLVPSANTGKVILRQLSIKKWSPASPKLYTAVISLIDKDGKTLDIERSRIGFKKIEALDGVVHINGERLLVHGVNRHEHYWKSGRTVSAEHMRQEIHEMKKMNINAVRTSHYPNSPVWYELCDELGILIVCEANLETHGVSGELTHNPAYALAFLDRAVRMILNYKNHVSIFSWSLGNESGTGANHAAMYGFIKEYDPHRLCQYEAGEPGKNISDIRGNMYPPVDYIIKLLCDPKDTRPVILVEYLYQICNAGGGLEHFIRLCNDYPRFQGGFVWDWQDKCLVGKTEDCSEFFAYGGDFNDDFVEEQNPKFMTCNGIVLPDLRWKPVAYELKQAYCPIRFEKSSRHAWNNPEPGKYLVRRVNCLHGIDGNDNLECTALLREDGYVIAKQPVEIPHLKTGEETVINNPFTDAKKPGREYSITFVLNLKQDTFYASKGYEVGAWQFLLKKAAKEAPAVLITDKAASANDVECTESKEGWTINAGGITAVVSKQSGLITELSKNAAVYLKSGSKPNLSRPVTGLDAQHDWGWYTDSEKMRRLEYRIVSYIPLINTPGSENIVILEFEFVMEHQGIPGAHGRLAYRFSESGKITTVFHIHIDSSITAIPRAGVALILNEGFENLEYYGYGPIENYPDRMLASQLAVHRTTVTGQHFPFVPPSETGGHEKTRWLKLERQDGKSIKVSSVTPFHFDARHSSIEDYLTASHDHKLIRRPETFLHIDAAHGPIGSEMAWSSLMPKQYELGGGSYHLEFDLELE